MLFGLLGLDEPQLSSPEDATLLRVNHSTLRPLARSTSNRWFGLSQLSPSAARASSRLSTPRTSFGVHRSTERLTSSTTTFGTTGPGRAPGWCGRSARRGARGSP